MPSQLTTALPLWAWLADFQAVRIKPLGADRVEVTGLIRKGQLAGPGGVSIAGGSGTIPGVVLAVFILSMAAALTGSGTPPTHPFLYWEFHEQGGKQAVRRGNWKAVRLNAVADRRAIRASLSRTSSSASRTSSPMPPPAVSPKRKRFRSTRCSSMAVSASAKPI